MAVATKHQKRSATRWWAFLVAGMVAAPAWAGPPADDGSPAPDEAADPPAAEQEIPSEPTDAAETTDAAEADEVPPPEAPQPDAPADAQSKGTETPAETPEPAPEADAPPAVEATAGDEAELESLLGQVVVDGASRTAETGTDAPATVQVITATELRVFGIRTVDEALNFLSMGVVATPAGATGQTGARGIVMTDDWGSHILVLIDGHVLNASGSGIVSFDRLAGLPVDLIDRIELIFGPGSVLYGNNAMLMVVNIVMKDGADVDGFEIAGSGAISPNQNRYGNFTYLDRERIGHRERIAARYGKAFDVRDTDGDVVLHAEYLNDQLPRFQLGPQYHPEVRDLFDFGPNTGSGDPTVWGGYAGDHAMGPSAYGRLRIDDFTLTGRTSWITLTSPRTALEFGDDGFKSSTSTSFFDARYDYIVAKKVSGLVRLYGDHFLYRQRLAFPSQLFCGAVPAPCSLHVASESLRGGLENQWSFDWFADGRYMTMIGADARVLNYAARVYTADQLGNATWDAEGTDDDLSGAVGVYAQQILRVHPRISFNAGARYDYFSNLQAVSPRGAAIFVPWRDAALKLIYSQAFRGPSQTERSVDPDLDPEVVRSVELSLAQGLGHHQLTVAGFAGSWTDLIQRHFETDPANPGVIDLKYRNANMLWNIGGSVGYRSTIRKLTLALNATYAWTRVRLGGWSGGDIELTDGELADLGFSREAADEFGRNQPLSTTPAFTGNVRLAYAFGRDKPTIAVAGQLVSPRLIADVYSNPTLIELVNEGNDTSVPTTFTGRAVLTHEIGRFRWGGLGYNLGVEATSNTATPRSVGPFRAYTVDDNQSRQIELYQIPRLTVFTGLRVTFGRSKGK